MMAKRGLAVPASVDKQHLLAASIAGRTPDMVAVWAPGLALDVSVVRDLVALDIQPLVYAQTARWGATDILAGHYDAEIDAFAHKLIQFGRIIVRVNQEANGPGLRAEWNTWPEATYIAVWRYIERRIHAIAPDVRLAYCITWRGKDHRDDFARWYPGHDACQIVGFDSYVTNPIQRPSRIWPVAIRTIRETTPSKPIWVFEAGVSRWVPFRGRKLREMQRVEGLEGVVYMDMDLEHYGARHRWALNERLRRLWR